MGFGLDGLTRHEFDQLDDFLEVDYLFVLVGVEVRVLLRASEQSLSLAHRIPLANPVFLVV